MPVAEYKALLIKTIVAIMVCSVIVCLGYFFFDVRIAQFMHQHAFNQYSGFRWMTMIPIYFWYGAPLLMIYVVIKRAYVQTAPIENALFVASISLFVTKGFVDVLKFCFGRYWPDTWINHNPSLLQNDAYGFHPFHIGPAFHSFPSGHTAATVSVLTVFWLMYPSWRRFLILFYPIVPIGLLCMNYHFFTDIMAGAFLGAIVSNYAVGISALEDTSKVGAQ